MSACWLSLGSSNTACSMPAFYQPRDRCQMPCSIGPSSWYSSSDLRTHLWRFDVTGSCSRPCLNGRQEATYPSGCKKKSLPCADRQKIMFLISTSSFRAHRPYKRIYTLCDIFILEAVKLRKRPKNKAPVLR